MTNNTAHAITALQEELTQLSGVVLQNRMALDVLLASRGAVCAMGNPSCCVYVGQPRQLSTDMKDVWEEGSSLHKVQQDGTSLAFQEVWPWLTSWILGNLHEENIVWNIILWLGLSNSICVLTVL